MAKSTRIKIPKRVAGIKIPKGIRKGPFMDFLNSSAGQLLLAEAAMAAATLFAAKQGTGETTRDTLAQPLDMVQRAGRKARGGDETLDSLSRSSARLQFALGEAVRAFRAALEGSQPLPDASDESAGRPPEPEIATGKKKNWSPSEPPAH